MTSLNKIFIWGGLSVAAAAFYFLSSDEAPALKKPVSIPHAAPVLDTDDQFTEADYHAHFDRPKAKLRNVFMAGSGTTEGETGLQPIDHIPGVFAEGDANWTFTGIAQVNGTTMALLENSQKHQGGFVKEGEHWKGSLVKRITSESIVMIDKDGSQQVVMRFNPNKPSKNAATVNPSLPGPLPPVGGPQPGGPPPGMPPGFRGPMGGGVVISGPIGVTVSEGD